MNYNIARSLGLFQAADISKPERRARGAGGGGRGELARESKRNESERRGDREKARGGGKRARGCFARGCAPREGDEGGGEGRALWERLGLHALREFKTDMLISLGARGGDSRTPSCPLKGRSLASTARL